MVLEAERAALRELTKEQLIDEIMAGRVREAEARGREATLLRRVDPQRRAKPRSPATWTFRVLRWEWGEHTFHPRAEPQPITVRNLRVFIHPDDRGEGAPYWDISSKRLQAVLEPILPKISGTGASVRVNKDGEGKTSTYSVSVFPP